jgi:ribosomal-protein-alanine N-acetyltransferase
MPVSELPVSDGPAFELHRLGAADVDRASALHGAAFMLIGERGWTGQEIAGLIALPGVSGLLLICSDTAIGMALCRVAADEAELLTIAVDVGHRRQGAGRALLAAVIAHVQAEGATALFLEVGADNPAARSLYEQNGFRTVGRRAAYYQRGDGPAADALVMRRDVRPGG